MNKEHDPFLIFSIAILLCVFRVIVRDSKYLNEIMALINIVALNYSLWCMFNEADKIFRTRMKESPLGKEMFKNKIKLFKRDRYITEIIIFIICAFLYLRYMKSATGNDILTIIALCFALEANSFSVKIANYYYKKRK